MTLSGSAARQVHARRAGQYEIAAFFLEAPTGNLYVDFRDGVKERAFERGWFEREVLPAALMQAPRSVVYRIGLTADSASLYFRLRRCPSSFCIKSFRAARWSSGNSMNSIPIPLPLIERRTTALPRTGPLGRSN